MMKRGEDFLIKLLGSVMVLLASTGIGILAGERKKLRMKQLKELMVHMKVMYGEIEYGRTALPEVMEVIAKRNQGDMTGFFRKVARELSEIRGETFFCIWKRCMETELAATCLDKKDKLLLEGLGENLGFLDQKMQLSTIGHYMMNLEGAIEEAAADVKEKVRLYNLLGVLFGIFITIVML